MQCIYIYTIQQYNSGGIYYTVVEIPLFWLLVWQDGAGNAPLRSAMVDYGAAAPKTSAARFLTGQTHCQHVKDT